MTVVSVVLLCWGGNAQGQSSGCDMSRAAELESRLKQQLEAWAAESPDQALQWVQRLEERRGEIARQRHNACTLYRQLLDELDQAGVAR